MGKNVIRKRVKTSGIKKKITATITTATANSLKNTSKCCFEKGEF